MIPAKHIASLGLSWPNIRRYGRQLYPLEDVWSDLDKRSEVSPEAALGIAVVHHLVAKHVLNDQEAISVVSFFSDAVTRYAHRTFGLISDLHCSAIRTEDVRVPVIMLEIVEGRWAKLGQGERDLFDIKEQQRTTAAETTQDRASAVWSHSVCLLPLFLKVCPIGHDHGNKHSPSKNAD